MQYKVSILIAAYNAEKYIRECLESICGQTLQEIQIICIDDASTDGTLSILHSYEKKDTRITVLSQPTNQGQAVARNRGLEIATGTFVTMLDSDDWLAPDALEKAYEITEIYPQTDAVLLDIHYYYENTGKYTPYHYRTEKKHFTGEEALAASIDWSIHGIYLIRNHIHKKYPYDTFSRMYSDDNTTRLHYLHSREVRISTGIYYYRQHENSHTKVHNIHRFDWLDAGLSLKKSLLKEQVNPAIIAQQENLRWTIIIGLYIYYLQHKNHFTLSEQQEILNRIKEHIAQVDPRLLRPGIKYRFGYYPFIKAFPLFRAEVWLYHRLRNILYKIKNIFQH